MVSFSEGRKRICILHHVGGLGGGSKSFIDLSMMLKEQYEVIACIPEGESPLKELLLAHEIKIHEMSMPYPQFPRYSGGPNLVSRTMFKFLCNLRFIKNFCREIESLAPEMVIYNSIVTIVSAPFLAKDIKKVCFIRETIVDRFASIFFKSILKHDFSGACFLSHHDQNNLSVNTLNSIVVPDSVPLSGVLLGDKESARVEEGIPRDKFVVLYMGGDDRIKGADTILEAFKYVDDSKQLVVAGSFMRESINMKRLWNIKEIVYKHKLEKKYRCLEQKGKVIATGMRTDISGLMNACDIVVFPSTKVHQPRPCIEAGFYFRPVIISDFEQTKEYFIDGYNALTFKSNSARELAEKINYACANPIKMEEMGKKNREMSETFHNYEAIQENVHKFIVNILG